MASLNKTNSMSLALNTTSATTPYQGTVVKSCSTTGSCTLLYQQKYLTPTVDSFAEWGTAVPTAIQAGELVAALMQQDTGAGGRMCAARLQLLPVISVCQSMVQNMPTDPCTHRMQVRNAQHRLSFCQAKKKVQSVITVICSKNYFSHYSPHLFAVRSHHLAH